MDYRDFFTDKRSRELFEALIQNPDATMDQLMEIANLEWKEIEEFLPLMSEDDQRAFHDAWDTVQKRKQETLYKP
ncbi:MAG: hypothetical protein U1A25_01205 [Candidatus Sungbacteria bacterium]|nr:hypothetical protein [Candidatus Sungbacteria bacterium]